MVVSQWDGTIIFWCMATQGIEYVFRECRNQYGLGQEIQRGLLGISLDTLSRFGFEGRAYFELESV